VPRAIDVRHLGVPHVICCHEVDGFLVDPGPESAVATLLEQLGDEPPRAILLTHIHFDHAGAAGALVRRWPQVEVWVHERGARHLVDPERLVASARRIWPDGEFDRLWGEVVPVPEGNLRVLAGGESIDGFRVAYTPGHASHHVAYLREDTGTAYTGDVAGVRIGASPILPPTPPPDVDVDAWLASIAAVRAWDPERLALTHFGVHEGDVREHLAVLGESLRLWAELARHVDERAYAEAVRRRVGAGADAQAVALAADPETLWAGLHRYWSQRGDVCSTAP
jgi:glyoxylase-like metal-dependent hydrolase (beta-lactamase superfamily II)